MPKPFPVKDFFLPGGRLSKLETELVVKNHYLQEKLEAQTKAANHWFLEANRDHNTLIKLMAIIEQLALIPADDFYRPGDYAAGMVTEAWIKARDLVSL